MAAALALSTSISYGLANYFGPRLARTAPLFVVLIAGQLGALILSAGVVVANGHAVPGATGFALAAAAGLGNIGGLTFFFLAAATGPFSIVAPIVATSAILPVSVGLAGGDPLTVLKLAGIALALGGVVLVSRTPRASRVISSTPVSRTVTLALCSALATGVFLALLKPAAHRAGTDWAVMISRASLAAGTMALALRAGSIAPAREGMQRLRASRLPIIVLPGLLLFAGTFAYTTATQKGELSIVAVLSSLYPLVTVGLAMALDGERLNRQRAAGIVAALAGVVLLSL